MSTSCSLPLSFNPFLFHRPQPPLLDTNLFSPFPISKLSVSPNILSLGLSFAYPSPPQTTPITREKRPGGSAKSNDGCGRSSGGSARSQCQAEQESLCEISALKSRVQELECQSEIQGASVANVAALLQLLKKEGELGKVVNRIAESRSSGVPMVLEAAESGQAEEVLVVKEVVREGKEVEKRATLRKGSEGEDVRAMQVCLLAICISLLSN